MKLPPNTCPMIDRVKKALEEAYSLAYSECDDEDVEDLQSTLRRIEHILQGEADILEDIRDANSALRQAAEYYRDEAEKVDER